MLASIKDQLVVNLVGDNEQVVLTRNFGKVLKHFSRAQCASWIVRVDQNNGFGARVDSLLNVL